MNITGIIAEYNPFHLGHAYHLAEARRMTNADFIIVVMSGDFVQRGEPALFNKYLRAQMALENGADLVLELPAPFATAGGEDFAGGAVAILDKLGVITHLVFGSESGELSDILSAAKLLENESKETSILIRQGLKKGLSYPAAVSQAFQTAGHVTTDCTPKIIQTLSMPNNLLGVEYCRALKRRSSSTTPVTIKRLGSYHANDLAVSGLSPREGIDHSPVGNAAVYASASAIRQTFMGSSPTDALDRIKDDIPASALALLRKECGISGPLSANDFTNALFYKLLSENDETLSRYLDISPELANRILNQLPLCHSYTQLAETVKCKSYTRLRINRALLHCLLGITDEAMAAYKQNDYTGYARVLGIKGNALPLLREINRHTSLSLLMRMKEDSQRLSETDRQLLDCNDFTSDLYRMTAQQNYQSTLPDEYSRKLLKR